MDATHGTNMDDFQLITLLVIDDHGEGLPVAWAVSNKENTVVLTEFLKAVKAKVGDLHPDIFMSDNAEQYWNAWCSAFGAHNTRKLLCAWHIDRAWHHGLQDHI